MTQACNPALGGSDQRLTNLFPGYIVLCNLFWKKEEGEEGGGREGSGSGEKIENGKKD